MRDRLRPLLLVLILAAGPLMGQAQPVPLDTYDWKPWVDLRAADGGVFPNLMGLVFGRMGVHFETAFRPWKRAEEELRRGIVWAAFPYRYSAGRESEFWFSDPIVRTTMVLFTVRGGKVSGGQTFDTLADLKPYRVGGVLGSWYEGELEEAGVDVEWTSTLESNFQKLRLGRVDVVVAESAAGWLAAKAVFDDPAVLVTRVTAESNSAFRLMVSRSYPGARDLLDRFNRALAIEQKTDEWLALVDEIRLTP
jgi:polar amino acid transport system substrate-binding protein